MGEKYNNEEIDYSENAQNNVWDNNQDNSELCRQCLVDSLFISTHQVSGSCS